MKKVLGVSILGILLAACADSGQGGPAASDMGTNSSAGAQVNVSEPGVAPEPGTRPVLSTGAVTETPARPAPIPSEAVTKPESSGSAQPAEQPGATQQQNANEQGTQITPEPKTGDDANPDSVNPRR
jgi:hypothetical protein